MHHEGLSKAHASLATSNVATAPSTGFANRRASFVLKQQIKLDWVLQKTNGVSLKNKHSNTMEASQNQYTSSWSLKQWTTVKWCLQTLCWRKLAKSCGLALGMARCIKYNTTGATNDQQCWWSFEFVLWCKRTWIVIGAVFITQALHTIGHTMIPLRMTTQLVHWQSSQFCLGWDESKGSFEIILLWRDVGNVMPYTSTCQCRANCRNIRTSPVVSSMLAANYANCSTASASGWAPLFWWSW